MKIQDVGKNQGRGDDPHRDRNRDRTPDKGDGCNRDRTQAKGDDRNQANGDDRNRDRAQAPMTDVDEESTTQLLEIFGRLDDDEKETFLEGRPETPPTPQAWFARFFAKSPVQKKDVARCCEGRYAHSYIYAVLNGEKVRPSRDMVLLICLAAHMDRRQTRQVLELYQYRDLYIKDNRDVLIGIAINRGEYDVDALNDRLESYGLETL